MSLRNRVEAENKASREGHVQYDRNTAQMMPCVPNEFRIICKYI